MRVTVAYKLEPVENRSVAPVPAPGDLPFAVSEVERNGPQRVYRILAGAASIAVLVAERLWETGRTLRIPGYRPGKIPLELLESHYGARTRAETISRIAGRASEHLLATGGLPVALDFIRGAESGDVEFRLTVTHLPDLPDAGFRNWEVERLTISDTVREEAAPSGVDAGQLLAKRIQMQVLDHVHQAFDFPVAAHLVEREMETIRRAAGIQFDGGENPTGALADFGKLLNDAFDWVPWWWNWPDATKSQRLPIPHSKPG